MVTEVKLQYVRWLMKNGKNAAAQQQIDSIDKKQQSDEVTTLRLLLAAQLGTLTQMITAYNRDTTTAPPLSILTSVASQLRVAGDSTSSRAILEYVFEQKFEQQQLASEDYLALAEARLATNDLPGALDLLRRITLTGDLYANLDAAASLLVKTGHTAEALPMLTKLANGVPWDTSYRMRLGEAQAALKQDAAPATLASVVANRNAEYATRVESALALQPLSDSPPNLGSAELAVLASKAPKTEDAAQPYFVYARISVAANAGASQRLALLTDAALVSPDSLQEWLRLQVFESCVANKKYEFANAVIQPLLTSQPWMRAASSEPDADSEDAQMNEADTVSAAAGPPSPTRTQRRQPTRSPRR